MRHYFFLFIFLISSLAVAQVKCVDLFSAANPQIVQNSSEETEILVKLKALVKTSIDIQLNNFERPAQLQQAKEQLSKQLTEIIAINRKFFDVFKTMRDQKSAELITTINEKYRKQREEKKEREERKRRKG